MRRSSANFKVIQWQRPVLTGNSIADDSPEIGAMIRAALRWVEDQWDDINPSQVWWDFTALATHDRISLRRNP